MVQSIHFEKWVPETQIVLSATTRHMPKIQTESPSRILVIFNSIWTSILRYEDLISFWFEGMLLVQPREGEWSETPAQLWDWYLYGRLWTNNSFIEERYQFSFITKFSDTKTKFEIFEASVHDIQDLRTDKPRITTNLFTDTRT